MLPIGTKALIAALLLGLLAGCAAPRAELRLETNTDVPHRLTIEMASAAPARVAV
jgi:hypothetical protein